MGLARWISAGLAGALAWVAATAAGAAPFRPAHDDEVLERLPAPLTAGRAQFRALRSTRARAASDLPSALARADGYIRIGREESDPRLYSYAEGVLRRWSDGPDPPPAVLLRRATIRQFRHDFGGALDDLDTLAASGYRDPQVWLLKASILRIQGRYAAAMDSCARLAAYGDRLVTVTCAAEVESLGGDGGAALESLTRAVEASGSGSPADLSASDVLVWSQGVLAGIAERQGQAEAAERWRRAVLARDPDNAFALAAYGDFLLEQGRPAEAVRLLEPHQGVDALLLRLAMAEAAVDPARARRLAPQIQARFDAVRARGDRPHLGDEARFELVLRRRPEVAYRLAEANWRTIREPRDALILAQSALATGQASAARSTLRRLAGHDVNDRRLAGLRARLQDLAAR
jgi:hypothetical protein